MGRGIRENTGTVGWCGMNIWLDLNIPFNSNYQFGSVTEPKVVADAFKFPQIQRGQK